MNLISLLFSNPRLFILLAVLLLYSIIFHEIAHGWVAYLFGDDTARRHGRLSLNPLTHLDPVGTIMLFVVGFGWAKPVPVDYRNLGGSRIALICVSLAGCSANILIAIAAIVFLRSNLVNIDSVFAGALAILIKINIILGSFNLIPIPPLDGSKVLAAFLPVSMQGILAKIEPYGFFLLAFLLYTHLLDPLISFMESIINLGILALLSVFK